LGITEDQNRAAGDFVELIARALGAGRAIHPETAIASAARLSGSLLLRSFEFDLETSQPGTVVLSDEANEKGPALLNVLAGFLARNNIELDPSKLGGMLDQRGHAPSLDTQASLVLLQEDALRIAARHSLSLQQAAEAVALATGFIVKECAPSIGAETGFNIAAFGFIEGSKSVPPRLGKPIHAPPPKPWYRFW
jgi:hypothetical protein